MRFFITIKEFLQKRRTKRENFVPLLRFQIEHTEINNRKERWGENIKEHKELTIKMCPLDNKRLPFVWDYYGAYWNLHFRSDEYDLPMVKEGQRCFLCIEIGGTENE